MGILDSFDAPATEALYVDRPGVDDVARHSGPRPHTLVELAPGVTEYAARPDELTAALAHLSGLLAQVDAAIAHIATLTQR